MAFTLIRCFLITAYMSVCFLLFSYADEKGVILTPRDTVTKWTRIYGIDMDRASDITTLEFRKGMTKKDWAAKYDSIIKSIEYKHLGGDIIAELTEDNKSMVVMQSKIMTIAGGINQVEIYELHKLDGTWLITNITVKEESEFGKSGLDKEI